MANRKYHIWLSESLKNEIQSVFSPRYNRKLSDIEIINIADSLCSYLDSYIRWKNNINYENK